MASNPLCFLDARGRPILELKMCLVVWHISRNSFRRGPFGP
jgi:hypothetical protein